MCIYMSTSNACLCFVFTRSTVYVKGPLTDADAHLCIRKVHSVIIFTPCVGLICPKSYRIIPYRVVIDSIHVVHPAVNADV